MDEKMETKKTKLYDFKRPDKFNREQLKAIYIIHEQFARLSTTSLSTRLKVPALTYLETIDQCTFGEFIASTPSPTTSAILHLDPLGSAVLEIDPIVTFMILEKLYGSGLTEAPKIKKNITEIETYLISDIISALISNLSTAWLFLTNIKPRLSHIETNPDMIQIINPGEMIILLRFKIKIGNSEGTMNLCIPYISIEPVLPILSPKFFYTGMKSSSTNKDKNKSKEKIFSLLEESNAKLSITINTSTIPLIEIDNIAKGDEIALCNLTDLVNININEVKVMQGNLGHINSKWSVKIRKYTNE